MARGERASKSKLTDADFLAVRREYAKGDVTMTALAKHYGVRSIDAIHNVVTRKTWKHI